VAPASPLDTELATLDARFAGPDAAALAWSPSRLVHDGVAAIQNASDASTRIVAAAQLDAALQVILVLAAENELANAAVALRSPGPPADGGVLDAALDVVVPPPVDAALDAGDTGFDAGPPIDWTGIASDWDRAAVFVAGLSDDLTALQGSSAFDVAAGGWAPLVRADIVAMTADLLARGRLGASQPATGYEAALTAEAQVALTEPFLLGALVAAGSLEAARSNPAQADPTAAIRASTLNEGVLQPLAVLGSFDASPERTVATASDSLTPPLLVQADARAYQALLDTTSAGLQTADRTAWQIASGSASGSVDALSVPLARAGIDPAALRASLLVAQSDLAVGNVGAATTRISAARDAIASQAVPGGH
jgi:hypothetical protein